MSLQPGRTLLPQLARILGIAATLGLLAQPAHSATWHAIEFSTGSSGSVTTDVGSTERFDARIQRSIEGSGIALMRVTSNANLNPPTKPSASGEWTFEVKLDDRFLFRPTNVDLDGRAAVHEISVTLVGALGGAIDNIVFSIFEADTGGTASGTALASLKGTGSLSTVLRGDAHYLLNVAGILLADLAPAIGGGPAVVGGYDAIVRVVPLPPAILAFLTGLGALLPFRRARRMSVNELVR